MGDYSFLPGQKPISPHSEQFLLCIILFIYFFFFYVYVFVVVLFLFFVCFFLFFLLFHTRIWEHFLRGTVIILSRSRVKEVYCVIILHHSHMKNNILKPGFVLFSRNDNHIFWQLWGSD